MKLCKIYISDAPLLNESTFSQSFMNSSHNRVYNNYESSIEVTVIFHKIRQICILSRKMIQKDIHTDLTYYRMICIEILKCLKSQRVFVFFSLFYLSFHPMKSKSSKSKIIKNLTIFHSLWK